MKCQQIQQQMIAYSENAVDTATLSQIEAHIQTCPACAQELRAIQQTLTILQATAVPEPSDAFWRDMTVNVMRKVRNSPSQPVERVQFLPRFQFAFAGIAMMLLVIAIYAYFKFHPVVSFDVATVSPQPTAVTIQGLPQTMTPAAGTTLIPAALPADILDTQFALFNGTSALDGERLSGADLLDVFLAEFTLEEKQAFLAELQKMQNLSQPNQLPATHETQDVER
jgi:hypothetical protein